MKILLAVLALAFTAFAEAPDTPSTVQPPPVAPATCGRYHWTCWTDPPHIISNREVFHSKAFWAMFLGDVAFSSFDAEMSHAGLAHRGCRYEANGNTSRWQLYRYNLPENAAAGVVAFIWLKVKGPKYVMPAFLARPAYVHIKAGMSWTQCW